MQYNARRLLGLGCFVVAMLPWYSLPAAAPRPSVARPPLALPAQLLVSSRMPSEAEVVRVPEELEALFRAEVIAKARYPEDRLNRLVDFMFEPWGLGLEYDGSVTRTVAQGFADRRGNCLSFTLTFIALARLAGLDAEMQESENAVVSMAGSRDVVYTGHVNVNVRINKRSAEVHFDPNRPLLRGIRKTVSRARALAHYYNNRGAELMDAGEFAQAELHYSRALALDPTMVPAHNNRGVLKLRLQDINAAEQSFMAALELDTERLSVLSNLVSLYRLQGQAMLESAFEQMVVRAQARNPFHHFLLGLQFEGDGDYTQALEHFREAARLDRKVALFRWAMSRALQSLGEYEEARRQARRAVALDKAAANPLREIQRCCLTSSYNFRFSDSR